MGLCKKKLKSCQGQSAIHNKPGTLLTASCVKYFLLKGKFSMLINSLIVFFFRVSTSPFDLLIQQTNQLLQALAYTINRSQILSPITLNSFRFFFCFCQFGLNSVSRSTLSLTTSSFSGKLRVDRDNNH